MKIRKIEINFPLPIELPKHFEQRLSELVDTACKKFESENPQYKMWPAGHGSKTLWREPEEPDFDDEVFEITVAIKDINVKFTDIFQVLNEPHSDCHYYEEIEDDFDSCPVVKYGESELTIHCSICKYNKYRKIGETQKKPEIQYCPDCHAVMDNEGCLFCNGGPLDESW